MKQILSNSVFVHGFLFIASVCALAAALTAEVAFELEPCIMCIYQRIPFAVVAVLSFVGLAFGRHAVSAYVAALSGLAMLVNTGLAIYHTGIEQKWWVSAVEGCSVPVLTDDPQTFLENIMSAPSAKCDEIPWVDPVLGFSMANWNIPFCLGLAVFAFAGFVFMQRRAH